MSPETEMASPSAVINGGDGSDATITCNSDATSKTSASNGGRGRSQVCCIGRVGHQGRDGQGRRFN